MMMMLIEDDAGRQAALVGMIEKVRFHFSYYELLLASRAPMHKWTRIGHL
jgi:hypothetical protein